LEDIDSGGKEGNENEQPNDNQLDSDKNEMENDVIEVEGKKNEDVISPKDPNMIIDPNIHIA